ncbi:MAG TPA: hypothetical protein VM077_00125 [Candidatus Limnocylindrales bacterium]|nr:hypothetical protein [Candidatus Limnocylindrales bacterium]
MRPEVLGGASHSSGSAEPRRDIVSHKTLIDRGRGLKTEGVGKHVRLIGEIPGGHLMVDTGIPLQIVDGIATGPAGAEAHADLRDVITVLEGSLDIVIGEILDPTVLIDKEGDAIATETRGTRILVEERMTLEAGDSYVVPMGKGHIHGNNPSTRTAISTFVKQPFV